MKIKDLLYKIFIKYQLALVLLVLIDQLTKIWAVNNLENDIVIFDWFKISLTINDGVAFSLLSSFPQWTTALVSVVAFGAIEYYLIFKKPTDKLFAAILLVIAAGAIGNGIDRWLAVFGRTITVSGTKMSGVVDFIYVTWFANFNVADIYVTLACVILLIYLIFGHDEGELTYKEMKEAKKKLKEQEIKDENHESN